jgi:hypothetical protein
MNMECIPKKCFNILNIFNREFHDISALCQKCAIITFKGLSALCAQRIDGIDGEERVHILHSAASVIEATVKTSRMDKKSTKQILATLNKVKKI